MVRTACIQGVIIEISETMHTSEHESVLIVILVFSNSLAPRLRVVCSKKITILTRR